MLFLAGSFVFWRGDADVRPKYFSPRPTKSKKPKKGKPVRKRSYVPTPSPKAQAPPSKIECNAEIHPPPIEMRHYGNIHHNPTYNGAVGGNDDNDSTYEEVDYSKCKPATLKVST